MRKRNSGANHAIYDIRLLTCSLTDGKIRPLRQFLFRILFLNEIAIKRCM